VRVTIYQEINSNGTIPYGLAYSGWGSALEFDYLIIRSRHIIYLRLTCNEFEAGSGLYAPFTESQQTAAQRLHRQLLGAPEAPTPKSVVKSPETIIKACLSPRPLTTTSCCLFAAIRINYPAVLGPPARSHES
jgi:hypothetical protein